MKGGIANGSEPSSTCSVIPDFQLPGPWKIVPYETKRRVNPLMLWKAEFFVFQPVTHGFGKSSENGIHKWQTYVRDRTGVDA
jgi:hypothetical protein